MPQQPLNNGPSVVPHRGTGHSSQRACHLSHAAAAPAPGPPQHPQALSLTTAATVGAGQGLPLNAARHRAFPSRRPQTRQRPPAGPPLRQFLWHSSRQSRLQAPQGMVPRLTMREGLPASSGNTSVASPQGPPLLLTTLQLLGSSPGHLSATARRRWNSAPGSALVGRSSQRGCSTMGQASPASRPYCGRHLSRGSRAPTGLSLLVGAPIYRRCTQNLPLRVPDCSGSF